MTNQQMDRLLGEIVAMMGRTVWDMGRRSTRRMGCYKIKVPVFIPKEKNFRKLIALDYQLRHSGEVGEGIEKESSRRSLEDSQKAQDLLSQLRDEPQAMPSDNLRQDSLIWPIVLQDGPLASSSSRRPADHEAYDLHSEDLIGQDDDDLDDFDEDHAEARDGINDGFPVGSHALVQATDDILDDDFDDPFGYPLPKPNTDRPANTHAPQDILLQQPQETDDIFDDNFDDPFSYPLPPSKVYRLADKLAKPHYSNSLDRPSQAYQETDDILDDNFDDPFSYPAPGSMAPQHGLSYIPGDRLSQIHQDETGATYVSDDDDILFEAEAEASEPYLFSQGPVFQPYQEAVDILHDDFDGPYSCTIRSPISLHQTNTCFPGNEVSQIRSDEVGITYVSDDDDMLFNGCDDGFDEPEASFDETMTQDDGFDTSFSSQDVSQEPQTPPRSLQVRNQAGWSQQNPVVSPSSYRRDQDPFDPFDPFDDPIPETHAPYRLSSTPAVNVLDSADDHDIDMDEFERELHESDESMKRGKILDYSQSAWG